MACDQLQCRQVGSRELSDALKILGSNSEVDHFRVQFRNGLLIKRYNLAITLQFFNQDRISTPVRGANPYKNSGFRPKAD